MMGTGSGRMGPLQMSGMCPHCSMDWKHMENHVVFGTRAHCNLVGKGSVDLGDKWHHGGSAEGHMSLSHTHTMSQRNPAAKKKTLMVSNVLWANTLKNTYICRYDFSIMCQIYM